MVILDMMVAGVIAAGPVAAAPSELQVPQQSESGLSEPGRCSTEQSVDRPAGIYSGCGEIPTQARYGVDGRYRPGTFEERLAAAQSAVLQRLRAASESGDVSLVLSPQALREIQVLDLLQSEGDDSIESRYLVGWMHWMRCRALPESAREASWRAALENLIGSFVVSLEPDPPLVEPTFPRELLPYLIAGAGRIALDMTRRGNETDDVATLSAAVGLWQRLVGFTSDESLFPARHPLQLGAMSSLGGAMRSLFEATGETEVLDDAIELCRTAVNFTAQNNSDIATRAFNLASALCARFDIDKSLHDLDEAVEVGRLAVAVDIDAPFYRATYLSELAASLVKRYEATGDRADIDDAVALGRQAAAVATTIGSGVVVAKLGASLRTRFEHDGAVQDIDEAVEVSRRAVAMEAVQDSAHYVVLTNLIVTLAVRAEHHGRREDLDEAVAACRHAVDALHPGDPSLYKRISLLGFALRTVFESTDDVKDLDQAIDGARTAVTGAASLGPLEFAEEMSQLAQLLGKRLDRSHSRNDFDEIADVVAATQPRVVENHKDASKWLTYLSIAYRARFEHSNDLTDLDTAAELAGRAAELTLADPDTQPDTGALSNLGQILQSRFETAGAGSDLNESIRLGREALLATPADARDYVAAVGNLLGVLRLRFERTSNPADLLEAIELGRPIAAGISTGHPDHGYLLTNLASALKVWAESTLIADDLDEAITIGRQALSVLNVGSGLHTRALSNLGTILLVRYQKFSNADDLDEGIEFTRQALASTPEPGHQRDVILFNYGSMLFERFKRHGRHEDSEASTSILESIISGSLPPRMRILAARCAGILHAENDPARAAELLRSGVLLFPELASRRQAFDDHMYSLQGYFGMASRAAALTLTGASPSDSQAAATQALHVLEAGRMVMLSERLHTRSELMELAEQHPMLAQEFMQLRDQLERSELDHPIHGRPRLVRDMEHLRGRIRAQRGFGSFGQPPAIGDLLTQAVDGPVVVFNVDASRSDALLLTTNGVDSLSLPGVGSADVVRELGRFQDALVGAQEGTRAVQRRAAQRQLSGVLEWLWDNAAGPVLDALGYRDRPSEGQPWPRIWWAPGGVLGLLPIHAAGYHGTSATVLDRVVSSYTPTVAALRYARRKALHTVTDDQRALIIAMPRTPGLAHDLDHATAEAEGLRRRFTGAIALLEPETPDAAASAASSTLAHSLPTRANVLEWLPQCEIAHFACHGVNKPASPDRSQLLLHDHVARPFTVATLTALRLDRAELAYLSACTTAANTNLALIDEAIHLASAFQIGGYPHVIGTLWAIDDQTSVEISDVFYRELRAHASNPLLDTSRSAFALHQAVRAVRDRMVDTPTLWAGYIHSGA